MCLSIKGQLCKLLQLPEGWYDGQGSKYEPSAIHALIVFMYEYCSGPYIVYVYPVPDGSVLFEWSFPTSECSLEVCLTDWTACWLAFYKDDSFCERDLRLHNSEDRAFLAESLKENHEKKCS